MSDAVLLYVFPCVGCVISAGMYGSSLRAVARVRKSRELGVRIDHRGIL